MEIEGGLEVQSRAFRFPRENRSERQGGQASYTTNFTLDLAGKRGCAAKETELESKAQDLKRNVVTTGSHKALPEPKRSNVDDQDLQDPDEQISRL